MNIIIKIRVSPAVKKYIAHRHDIKPFIVSRTNLYGIFLHGCLVRLYGDPVLESKFLNLNVYSEDLELGLSEDLYSRRGWCIHPKKQYDFNRLVEMMMEQDFIFWVETQTQVCGAKQIEAFYEFRELFHLTEDDLTLKTMEKRYERYRKSINT